MTSAEEMYNALFNKTKVEVVKGKPLKPRRGIKVSTLGFAGAGLMLRRLRSVKVSGKAHDRVGKRSSYTPVIDEVTHVLSDIKTGTIKFDVGSSINVNFPLNKASYMSDVISGNGGSFIKRPLDDMPVDNKMSSVVAKISDPKGSCDNTSIGVVDDTGYAPNCPMDATDSAKTGGGFEFGKDRDSSGLLKKHVDRFAKKLKQGSEEMALKMEFTPDSVVKQDNGKRRIEVTAEEVIKGGQDCYIQLYGYFVGTLMDYRVVRVRKRMKKVLESGPWMVQNVPLVLNVWEPGIWLDKIEPSVIPIWVCVYNIPMELYNGNGIGKIMSGVGKPLLMDNMTKQSCLKKLGNRPAKVGMLDVKYQWKPPFCTHCKTFRNFTLSCKVRPRTEEEIAAKSLRDALKIDRPDSDLSGKKDVDDEGFTVVGKKNRPASSLMNLGQVRAGGQSNRGGRVQMNSRQGYSNKRRRNGGFVSVSKLSVNDPSKGSLVDKPTLASTYSQNFRPRVLVRGSGSANVDTSYNTSCFRSLYDIM
ncbi:RNA-directed DNA polymerase, eukaryota, reverse transcriptase zinc-binding domain protein [Tanacetum coccineum]